MNTYSRIYSALLLLYPARFRARFGREMTQIFADCFTGVPQFWLNTIKDLCVSIPREWRRELTAPDSAIDFTGIVDAFMVSVVVGSNLIGWGWGAAAITLHLFSGGAIFNPTLSRGYWYPMLFILVAIVTIAMAALIGIASALIVGHFGRVEGTRIKV